jgi:RHS repeat-associated protein
VQRSYEFDDWGGLINGADAKPFTNADRARFQGALWIGPEADVYYMRARWYEPTSGRFLSEDPIGLYGGINSYVYAGDDPINASDPTGMQCLVDQQEMIDGTWVTTGHRDAREGEILPGYDGELIICKGGNWEPLVGGPLGPGPGGNDDGGTREHGRGPSGQPPPPPRQPQPPVPPPARRCTIAGIGADARVGARVTAQVGMVVGPIIGGVAGFTAGSTTGALAGAIVGAPTGVGAIAGAVGGFIGGGYEGGFYGSLVGSIAGPVIGGALGYTGGAFAGIVDRCIF